MRATLVRMQFWPAHRALEMVLADLDAQISGSPADAEAHFLRGGILRDLGRPIESLAAYERAVALEPSHALATVALAAALARDGHRDRPRALLEALLHDQPEHPAANVSYANLLGLNDPQRARQHFELALAVAPSLKEAHEGLCSLLAMLGDEEGAARHRREAYEGRPTTLMPYRGERWPVPALLLLSTDGGNLFAEDLLDDGIFQTTKLYVEAFEPGEPLPPHAIVVNAIADADRNQATLERAGQLLRSSTARVINHPARVASTGREEIAGRLQRIEGVRTPWIAPFDRARVPAFPFLLRAPGFHMGRHFVRVEDDVQLARALEALPAGKLHAIEYLDTRRTDGWYRKYRVMIIDGALHPLHLAASRDWKVHYFSSAMFESASLRDEERAFLEDMKGEIGEPATRALELIAVELDLDYAGVDFALDERGNVVVFEANAAMTVIFPDNDERFVYRRDPTQRVLDAMQTLTSENA